MFFELLKEHLDLISFEGECGAKEKEFFPELSRFFIKVKRGVSDMLSFLTVFMILPPDSQVKPNTCETLFIYIWTSSVSDESSLLAVISERWV